MAARTAFRHPIIQTRFGPDAAPNKALGMHSTECGLLASPKTGKHRVEPDIGRPPLSPLSTPNSPGSPTPEAFSPSFRRTSAPREQSNHPAESRREMAPAQPQPHSKTPSVKALAPEKFEKVAMCIFDFEKSCPIDNAVQHLEASLRECKSAYELCHSSVTNVSRHEIQHCLATLAHMKCIQWDERSDRLSSIDVSKLGNVHL